MVTEHSKRPRYTSLQFFYKEQTCFTDYSSSDDGSTYRLWIKDTF